MPTSRARGRALALPEWIGAETELRIRGRRACSASAPFNAVRSVRTASNGLGEASSARKISERTTAGSSDRPAAASATLNPVVNSRGLNRPSRPATEAIRDAIVAASGAISASTCLMAGTFKSVGLCHTLPICSCFKFRPTRSLADPNRQDASTASACKSDCSLDAELDRPVSGLSRRSMPRWPVFDRIVLDGRLIVVTSLRRLAGSSSPRRRPGTSAARALDDTLDLAARSVLRSPAIAPSLLPAG